MQVFMNYILVLLIILFIIHVLIQYRFSAKDKEVNLGLGKLIILTVALIGHGTIISTNGVNDISLQITGINLLVIISLVFVSHYIDFLEPVIWHIIALLHLIGSITLHRLNPDLSIKHNIIAILGFVIMLFIGYIVTKIKFFNILTYLYMAVAIALLLIVNSSTNGATNWFALGDFSFQPSEFVKIIFAFYLASSFKKAYNFTQLLIGSAVSGIIVLILVYQRDLGSALLFFVLYMVLSYMYSRKRWLSFLQLGALSIGGYVAYTLFSHVKTRIFAWQDPFSYIDKQGYQITQGLFAFANGKWMGTGLTLGEPKRIPVIESDFIFAAIGEEFGSIFAILLILLFLILIITLLSQCQKTFSIFNAYVGVGLVVIFGFQGFLIIGGVIKLIPLTGVTLPFVSYGGTSLIASILSIGIIEAITKAKNNAVEREYRAHTIVTIKGIMVMLYLLLIGYLMYFLVFESENIQLNSYNTRLDSIEQNILRGSIYDSTNKTLAYSAIDGDKIKRYYPYDEMFSHVVGYSQIGKTGIEAYMNVELLNGHLNFFEQIKENLSGDIKEGSDIYLTINYNLQKIAYDALGDRKGAILAIEPSTGKILAMVSKPDYNPNNIEEIYKTLLESNEGELLNRTTNGVYPPGSTFKIITALEYIHENGSDFHYFCKGEDIFGHKYIRCYNDTAHGRMDLKSAFAMSCNTSFATMGEEISMSRLQVLADDLMFNRYLPYEYDHMTSSFILPEKVSDELRGEMVIGQGETMITPLHNLLITSAIANGGQLMKPYLVDQVVNQLGELVSKSLPENVQTLLSTDDTLLLKEYMSEVVLTGTGKSLLNDSYTAAGKTGAAENPFGDTHAWFVGFAPVEAPEIAIAIIVENAGSSGANSVPIAKEMFDYLLIKP